MDEKQMKLKKEIGEMKEELHSIIEDIDARTQKFNKSLEKLKNRKTALEKDIEKDEGILAKLEAEHFEAMCAMNGYTSKEILDILQQVRDGRTVTLTKKATESEKDAVELT